MLTEKESKLQRQCQKLFKDHGAVVFKNNGNMYTEKGRPDLVACVPTNLQILKDMLSNNDKALSEIKIGIFVSVELKREGHLGEVSEAQEIVGKNILAAEGIWIATDDKYVVEVLLDKLTGI